MADSQQILSAKPKTQFFFRGLKNKNGTWVKTPGDYTLLKVQAAGTLLADAEVMAFFGAVSDNYKKVVTKNKKNRAFLTNEQNKVMELQEAHWGLLDFFAESGGVSKEAEAELEAAKLEAALEQAHPAPARVETHAVVGQPIDVAVKPKKAVQKTDTPAERNRMSNEEVAKIIDRLHTGDTYAFFKNLEDDDDTPRTIAEMREFYFKVHQITSHYIVLNWRSRAGGDVRWLTGGRIGLADFAESFLRCNVTKQESRIEQLEAM